MINKKILVLIILLSIYLLIEQYINYKSFYNLILQEFKNNIIVPKKKYNISGEITSITSEKKIIYKANNASIIPYNEYYIVLQRYRNDTNIKSNDYKYYNLNSLIIYDNNFRKISEKIINFNGHKNGDLIEDIRLFKKKNDNTAGVLVTREKFQNFKRFSHCADNIHLKDKEY
jgi:hypothetical protein